MSMLLSMIVMMMVVFQMPVKAAPAEDMTIIYTQVPQDWKEPCIWAWDEDGNNAFEAWPGETMKADSSNEGWYYAWVPSWANHVIINGNEGNIQTEEQILEGKNTWITVASEKEVAISYEQQTTGEIPEYVETFTVHAKVADSWKEPNLWAWSAPDGTNVFSTWPGEPLEEDKNGWLKKEIPGWVNSLIVNGNDGSVQTSDISIETGKDVWLVVKGPEEAEVYYEEPQVEQQKAETKVENKKNDETTEKKNDMTIVWIIVAVAAVAVVVTGIVIVKKKKEN